MEQPVNNSPLPDLCADGHVLIVTGFYPPQPGGSSVIMRNLLSRFNPASYSIVTVETKGAVSIEGSEQAAIYPVMSSVSFSSRVDKKWRDWQLPLMVSRVVRIAQQVRPMVIVGVYPDYHFLYAARAAAKKLKIPWISYLHDTIVEALSHSHLAQRGAQLQKEVFQEASSTLVMSRGMADLYREKYHFSSTPLEHSYLEPIPEHIPEAQALRQAFWGGAIYSINARAVSRIADATSKIDCTFLLATDTEAATLERLGVRGDHLKQEFYSGRKEYLDALQRQGILVLALDYPDESPIHEDELSTIFPTKTPEYLASGRPILVHCPEHYFMARFIKENGCGLVVSERSVPALEEACRVLLENSQEVQEMGRCALKAAHLFAADRVASLFQDQVRKTAKVKWAEHIE